MIKRKALTIGLAGLAGLSLFGAILSGTRHVPARADAANYANQRRQIRACVLISDATQDADTAGPNGLYPSNTLPYVFYAMDKGNDLKPATFDFVNPLAPSILSQDIYNRWSNRNSANGNKDRAFQTNGGVAATPEAALFRINQPVTKNMAAYWEQNIDTLSSDDLQQYDVVMLPIHNGRAGANQLVQFTPLQQERLRRYVDAGGTVWMETTDNNFKGFDVSTFFIGVDVGATPPAGPIVSVAGHHPLVDYPYALTSQDMYGLGVQTQMNSPRFIDKLTSGGARPLTQSLQPIIQKGGVTTVWGGDYGGGHVVISSAHIATDINNLLIGSNAGGAAGSNVIDQNDGAVSGDNFSGIPAADMKFAYNLVSWLSSVPAPGSNSRRTGSTQENIGSTLTTKWAPIPIPTVKNAGSGATIYKGVTFWVDGNNIFHAYDVNPQRSLVGDINPDDGIPDLIYGASYDEIYNDSAKQFMSKNAGGIWPSTPTVISQYDSKTGTLYEAAAVTTTDGSTFFYNAFPRSGNKLASGASLAIGNAVSNSPGDMTPALSPGGNNGGIPSPSAGLPFAQPYVKPAPAPALSDGVLFTLVFSPPNSGATELGWRIAAVDVLASMRDGKNGLSVFDNGANASSNAQVAPSASFNGGLPGFYNPTGSLTVGEVKSTESDAVDRVVYVPVAADNLGNTARTGIIHTAWFSTRNEPLLLDNADPSKLTYMPNGQRARIPWYTNDGAVTTMPMMPEVHVAHRNIANGPVISVGTYGYKVDFDVSYQPEAGGQYHDVRVIFHSNVIGPNDTISADFTVDWPGNIVGNVAGSNIPSTLDMATITARRFGLFSPDPKQTLTETTGGIALSAQDNLLFCETNLHDALNGSGPGNDPPMPDRIFSVRDQYTSQVTGANPVRRPTALVNWMFSPLPATQFDNTVGGGAFSGMSIPSRLTYNGNAIYNFKATGSPASYNGTIYVIGTGYRNNPGPTSNIKPDLTVMLALNETVNTSFSIGPLSAPDATIQLVQPSFLHPQRPITLSAADFTLQRVQDPANPGTYVGVVDLTNFQEGTQDGDSFNTSLPVYVRGTSANGTPYVTPIFNPKTGFGPMDNLQYYVAFPIQQGGYTPTSGPSVAGGTLYFASLDNLGVSRVVTIDLAKAQLAGSTTGVAGSLSFVGATGTLIDANTAGGNLGNPLIAQMPSVSPPVGTTNVVVAPNAQGVVGLDNGLILISDNHRLLEVDAGGNAFWSMESTISQSQVGGSTQATGGLALKAIPLAHPMTSKRYGLNQFLIVDRDNNRIVGTNRGGSTQVEIHSFNDDMKFLRPGDPLSFNLPSDLDYFTEYYSSLSITNRDTKVTYSYANPCTVTHYLVADTGNFRIVDIADITDVNGSPVSLTGTDGSTVLGSKLLTFVTRSLAEQNQRYRYRTVQQFLYGSTSYIISSISNVRQGNAGGAGVQGNDDTNFEGPGGSLIAIQRSPLGVSQGAPPIALAAGDVYSTINSIVVTNPDGISYRRQPISNPTWFKEYSVFDPTAPGNGQVPRFLLADANGCYILKVAPITLNGQTTQEYVTDWMLTAQEYYFMTGRKLQATSITRETLSDVSSRNLFEARLLITNAYSGVDDITKNFGITSLEPTTGEVFEIKASAYYPVPGKAFLGYQIPGYQRYISGAKQINTTAITRMIPSEVPINNGPMGALSGIKRRIGSVDNSLTTYTLDTPQYAEHPL